MRGALLGVAPVLVTASAAAVAAPGASFTLTSPAFRAGAKIPKVYTCDGRNVSPPLRWTAPPAGTKALAILMDDPDAGSVPFLHWTAWNISTRARTLAADATGLVEGRNGGGDTGYTGPCPPTGTHRYIFRLYALKAPLRLPGRAPRTAFERAIAGKVVATARLVGRYRR
jgi:Raf kinase inhibitor-like YbhB/YbcL family protein